MIEAADIFRTVDVPEGNSGDWTVSRFSPLPTSRDLHNFRHPLRTIGDGPYTKLSHRCSVVMSDTPAEIRDLWPLRLHLKGRVLLNGLGLGVALQGALEHRDVDFVTVVEISVDVISLVGEHYQQRYGGRLTIIEADAMTWKPPTGVRFDAVWHDIWPDICGDYWPGMQVLHRRYGRRCDWQGSWSREAIRRASSA